MPRLASAALSALAAVALTGCLAVTNETWVETPTPTPPATASGTPEPVVDPYCEPADAGYAAFVELLDRTDAKSAQTGDGAGSVSVMNEEGAAMLAAAEQVELHWRQARAIAEEGGDAVVDAFDAYFAMFDAYTVPEAQLAATSTSIEEYSLAAAQLVMDGGVLAATTAGAMGLEEILRHHVDRCGVPGVS